MPNPKIGRSFLSWSGRVLDVWSMDKTDVTLTDIIHPLAMANRFGGHTRWPYPVAQHSINVYLTLKWMFDNDDYLAKHDVIQGVWEREGGTGHFPAVYPDPDAPKDYESDETGMLKSDILKQALIHDCTEAFLQDFIRPVKRAIEGYGKLEQDLWEKAIAPFFGVPKAMHPLVYVADNAMLLLERDCITSFDPDNAAHVEVWGDLDSKFDRSPLSPARCRPQTWVVSKMKMASALRSLFPEVVEKDKRVMESWAITGL